MAVDRAKDSSHYWYVITAFRPSGDSKMLARGKVKTKRWVTRKARAHRCDLVSVDLERGGKAYKFTKNPRRQREADDGEPLT